MHLPAAVVGSSSYEKGDSTGPWLDWLELTAPELSAFEKRMATALIECPCGTPNRKRVVAELMRIPAAVVGSGYDYQNFHSSVGLAAR
jgi:hypothetical protein